MNWTIKTLGGETQAANNPDAAAILAEAIEWWLQWSFENGRMV